MPNERSSSLLRKTLRFFKLDTEEDYSPEAASPAPSTAIHSAADDQASDLARLLNVKPDDVLIQRKTRRDGTSCTYFEAVLGNQFYSLTLAFSPDFLRAYLLRVSSAKGLSPRAVYSLLQSHGLLCDPQTVEEALAEVEKTGRKVKIARGRSPRAGRDKQALYTFLPSNQAYSQISPSFPLLAASSLTDLPPETRAIWVSPGQSLAELQPAVPGTDGKDVFGRTIPATDGDDQELVPGPGVRLNDDDLTFEADAHGYVYIHQQVVGIRDPFTLADDSFSAVFTYIPSQTISPPTADNIQRFLDQRGIKRGIDADACQHLIQVFREGGTSPIDFHLSRGCPPEHGREGELIFEVDCHRKPGKINPDGSIDFKETCFGLNVPAGIQLARLKPATEGRPGFTIFGEDLPATSGVAKKLIAGPHVDVVEQGEELIFQAAIDGHVSYQNETLQIHETLQVTADVDYATGNVDFSGDIVIAGSVLPGFSVKARGSIAVQGQVETGTNLDAGGDIIVGGGIVGAGTRVVARGSVTAKFIQNATVHTGRDLTVGSYIFNAVVRSEGTVAVNKGAGRSSGRIAGGQIIAAEGIQASFAGSPSGTITKLVVGIDPTAEESLRRCQIQLAKYREDLHHLHHLLGLEKVTLPRLKRLLRRTAPDKREQLAGYIYQWQKLDKTIRAMTARRTALQQNLTQPTPHARLAVNQIIYPGVKLQVGQHTAEVQLELKATDLTSDTWTEKLILQTAA